MHRILLQDTSFPDPNKQNEMLSFLTDRALLSFPPEDAPGRSEYIPDLFVFALSQSW